MVRSASLVLSFKGSEFFSPWPGLEMISRSQSVESEILEIYLVLWSTAAELAFETHAFAFIQAEESLFTPPP